MASNNNSRPGGRRPNSPRYSDRYGPGHMNPYLGGQPGQSAFIREMEERQEAARRQSELEQEKLRRQREQEAANRQREHEAARRAEAARAQAAQAANAEAQQRAQTEEPARRRGGEDNSQPRAMRDPDTRERLRQIQEKAVREAKSIARGDEADFGDIDFIQQPPDVRLRLSDDGQPLIALESDDGSGGTVVRWVPVVLSEKEMESFFPALGSAQESKGIDVQEEIRTPAEDTGSAQDDRSPEVNEPSVDDLVLIPIAGIDEQDNDVSAAAAVTAAAAMELLDSEPPQTETAAGKPVEEPAEMPDVETEVLPEPEVPRGGGLDALLSSLPVIEIGPEPEAESHAGDAAVMLAGAAVLAAAGNGADKQDDDDTGSVQSTEPPAVPVVEYNVPEDEDDDEEQSEPENEDEAEDEPSDDTGEDGDYEDSQDEYGDGLTADDGEESEDGIAEETASEAEEEDSDVEQAEDDVEESVSAVQDDAEADADDSQEDYVGEAAKESGADEADMSQEAASVDAADEDEPDNAAEDDSTEQEDPESEIPEQDDSAQPVQDEEDAEPALPPEPVRRPKHKRRRSRPTDVQMPEELAAAAAAREDSAAEEPQSEPEPEQPAPRRTAVAAVPFYDDGDNSGQDDRMFTRSSRSAARPVFAMHEGATLPKYIDDDDFVERWLGDEEDDEDLASQKKNRRRRISAFIGAATMILALIGLIAVAKWGIGLLGNIGGSESQKDIYGEFVSPVVMSEVPVFETWDAIPQDKLLQSAVFSVLMDNDVTYERDDTGKFIIPSTDIVNAVKMLYGAASDDPAQDEEINTQIRNALYGSAGEDVTNEDAYYVDMEDSFHVADGLSGPAPNVTDISKRDNTVTLRVEYLEDLENGTGGILYARQVILNLNEDGSYFVKGIREQQD